MKGTEQFKQTIKAYLDERAKRDELFAVSYAKENKNLDDCITFVLNQAMAICKEGGCGMTDNEVYSLCTHYYDEENIEVGNQDEELRTIRQRNNKPISTPKATKQEKPQPSLFDLGL